MRRDELLGEPIRHLELGKIKGIADLLEAFRYTSFQSRALANCFDVYSSMLDDEKRVTVFMGLSGALVAGGMRTVVVDMMEHGLIDVLVSTGANLYHDLAEANGPTHFVGSQHADDSKLRELNIDRIYDTYADETKFKALDERLSEIMDSLEPGAYSTREFLSFLGSQIDDENSILRKANIMDLPIFCPALNDSSLGIALAAYYARKRGDPKGMATIDPARDVYEIAQIMEKSEKTGVIYVGGGTPKNYIQQLEIVLDALGVIHGNRRGHNYAIQITTDDPKWGGLSGCTFEESQSWGKISIDSLRATCYIDASVGLPLLVGALLERRSGETRKSLNYKWEGDKLKELS
jgi:deoxyhypusine synthase